MGKGNARPAPVRTCVRARTHVVLLADMLSGDVLELQAVILLED